MEKIIKLLTDIVARLLALEKRVDKMEKTEKKRHGK